MLCSTLSVKPINEPSGSVGADTVELLCGCRLDLARLSSLPGLIWSLILICFNFNFNLTLILFLCHEPSGSGCCFGLI